MIVTNNVFQAIKKHVDAVGTNPRADRFKQIAKEANVPYDKIEDYLSRLQGLGLIRYSRTDNIIHLTASGRKQDKLFV